MSAATRRILRLRCNLINDAWRELSHAIEQYGEDHPAARAARGRFWFHAGRVPQKDATSIEAIAWARESAGCKSELRPIWNRSMRRHKKFTAQHKNRYPADTGAGLPTHEDQCVAPSLEMAQDAQ